MNGPKWITILNVHCIIVVVLNNFYAVLTYLLTVTKVVNYDIGSTSTDGLLGTSLLYSVNHATGEILIFHSTSNPLLVPCYTHSCPGSCTKRITLANSSNNSVCTGSGIAYHYTRSTLTTHHLHALQ